ncbi:MAG: DapH/DapD/GlmU-related protein [Candidatus Omnitrophica bacterium]|nr:DapH/DapD/GlmU-related protein [Candidatus Omnitrophota bacterium]
MVIWDVVMALEPYSAIIGSLSREFDHPADISNTDDTSIAFLSKINPSFETSTLRGVVIVDPSLVDDLIDSLIDENDLEKRTFVIPRDSRKLFIRILDKYFVNENCISEPLPEFPNVIFMGKQIKIGSNVVICPGCVIGGDGFSYERQEDNSLQKFWHYGGVEIGDNVEIGSNSCIDRGTFGNTIIGKGTKIDNLVHIAHNVIVGEDCIIVAFAGLGGGVKIGDRCFIGFGALIRDGITIGSDSTIGMGSVVTKDVPEGSIVMGNPAKEKRG